MRNIVGCHCTQCRRQTGHFMAATAARRADFRLLASDDLKWYSASSEARRGFCGVCGSTLLWDGVGLPYISIAAGTLDDANGLRTVCHIFVADKGHYYDLEPGVERIDDGNFSVPF